MSLEMPHSRDGKKTPEKFWVLTRFGFFEDNGSVLFDQSINQSINQSSTTFLSNQIKFICKQNTMQFIGNYIICKQTNGYSAKNRKRIEALIR